jgi:nitrogen fixation NifU-like protein
MIDAQIIKIALDTKNQGLCNIYTHKTTIRNKICGDKIKIEVVRKLNKILNMRYETEACIFCQASASMLSKKIKLFPVNQLIKDIILISNIIKGKNKVFPKKYNEFKKLLNKKYVNRIDCIVLPFNALKKALKNDL